MAPLDAVDGAMARLRGNPSLFGAFFDSVIDLYDELILLGALIYHFYKQADLTGVVLTFLAAMGSVLVSYTRARAEGLGLDAKTGILTRIERAIILIIGLLFAKPIYSVGIIAILANITAIQRICRVWQQSKAE
jgi:CDP-diacylglycerol--glycerol-3-phosphate 3-phosphatidyltransferase